MDSATLGSLNRAFLGTEGRAAQDEEAEAGRFYVDEFIESAAATSEAEVAAAINACAAAAYAYGAAWDQSGGTRGFGTVIFNDAHRYLVDADVVTFDISRANFIGSGQTRIETTDTTGTIISVTATNAPPPAGTSSWAGSQKLIQGFKVLGPRGDPLVDDLGSLIGMKLDATNANGDIARVVFDRIEVRGCDYGVYVEDNVHQVTFKNPVLAFNKIGFYVTSAPTNTGERITLEDASISDSALGIVNRGAISLFLSNSSLDYMDGQITDELGGSLAGVTNGHIVTSGEGVCVYGTNVHIEDNTDAVWLASYDDSLIQLRNVQMNVSGVIATNYIGHSASDTDKQAGVFINGMKLRAGSGFVCKKHLIGGSGPSRVQNMRLSDHDRPTATTGRKLKYPLGSEREDRYAELFNDATLPSYWDLTFSTSGSEPALDTNEHFEGARSLKFAVAVNNDDTYAVLPLDVIPGQKVRVAFWLKTENLDSTHRFTTTVQFFTPGTDTLLSSDEFQRSSQEANAVAAAGEANGWFLHHGFPIEVPPKASRALITFGSRGEDSWTAGTHRAWLDSLSVQLA